jgi:hypothetical protein
MFQLMMSTDRVCIMGRHPLPGQESRYEYLFLEELQNSASILGLDLVDGLQAVLMSCFGRLNNHLLYISHSQHRPIFLARSNSFNLVQRWRMYPNSSYVQSGVVSRA